MHADPLRVTVLVGGRRSDIVVPAGLPVAEPLPELVGRDPDVASPDTTRHLALPGGRPLDPEVTLQDQGVRAGAVLVLTSAAPLPPVPDDP
ncbi:EsaB/YukD family protein, partial [Nocardioides aquaticus]